MNQKVDIRAEQPAAAADAAGSFPFREPPFLRLAGKRPAPPEGGAGRLKYSSL